MITLFIDTSTTDVSIALVKDNTIISSITESLPNQHSIYTTSYIDKILKESKIEWGKFTRVLILSISFIALMIFICITLFSDFISNPTNIADWKLFILMFAILLVLYLPISIGIYFNTYIVKMKKNSYIRTKKGEELNENLEGLKNYLKDFSTMHERDEKSLTLWENYLIYSVIFNQNTKVIKNIWNKYISI